MVCGAWHYVQRRNNQKTNWVIGKIKGKIKEAKKVAKRSLPAILGEAKFEEQEIPLKLSDELTGNLRSLKPEGNLLEDRFKSLQKRNVFEPRTKKKAPKPAPKRRKKVEKRSYKMGFDWENKWWIWSDFIRLVKLYDLRLIVVVVG